MLLLISLQSHVVRVLPLEICEESFRFIRRNGKIGKLRNILKGLLLTFAENSLKTITTIKCLLDRDWKNPEKKSFEYESESSEKKVIRVPIRILLTKKKDSNQDTNPFLDQ